MSIGNHQPYRPPAELPGRDEFDEMLGRHFSRELEPQQGQARARFEELIESTPARRISPWIVAGAATALAASIALVVTVRGFMNGGKPQGEVTPVVSEIDAAPMELERTLAWRTVDEGTVLIEGNTPMRKVRREVLERVQYYDPGRQKLVEMTIPKEEVFLIGFNTY